MACHIFACLKQWPELKIVFDPSEPQVDESQFQHVDQKQACGDLEEELPPKMPQPRGNPVVISCFVKADHAGNKAT